MTSVPAQDTAVAMDFGRVSLDAGPILDLVGTSGQFKRDDVLSGAGGALPFIVVHNLFHGLISYIVGQVRAALSLPDDVPIVPCDICDRAATK